MADHKIWIRRRSLNTLILIWLWRRDKAIKYSSKQKNAKKSLKDREQKEWACCCLRHKVIQTCFILAIFSLPVPTPGLKPWTFGWRGKCSAVGSFSCFYCHKFVISMVEKYGCLKVMIVSRLFISNAYGWKIRLLYNNLCWQTIN